MDLGYDSLNTGEFVSHGDLDRRGAFIKKNMHTIDIYVV